MKITIANATYTKIKNLSFAPEADVTGSEVPINELMVDISTTDTITMGQWVYLYDDRDNLWARYWIIYAEHIDKQTVRVQGQSALKILERDMLDPVMYNAASLSTVLAEIFGELDNNDWEVDASFSSATITGFCPEQSAKTRLQWVCFVIGACIKSAFTAKIQILPIDNTATTIPIEKTYWKPRVTYKDYVTAINIITYTYTQTNPNTTDEWVTDGRTYFVQTKQNVRISNPNAPAAAPVNEIHIEDITLVNTSNVSGILSHLSQYYFMRQEVDLDCINNAEFEPGQRVTVYVDEDTMAEGYINSATFTFGIEAKSSIHLTASESKDSAILTITYKYQGDEILHETQLDKKDFTFPIGYSYSIQNPFLELWISPRRYVFRPIANSVTGTITSGVNAKTAYYAKALDLYKGVLNIISVDDVDFDSEEQTVVVIT